MSHERDLSEKLHELHDNGHLAVHRTHSPADMQDKFDDRVILNNLREDGGTELRDMDGYQLHTIISTTLLPPAKYRVTQNLYYISDLMIGLNAETSVIKSVAAADSQSFYQKNKMGRPSYEASYNIGELSPYSHEQRLSVLERFNAKTAHAATQPKPSWSTRHPKFTSPASFVRGLNEVLLKINTDSLLFIGTTAATVQSDPGVLLELINQQKRLREATGINYPIVIYNASNKPLALSTVDPSAPVLQTNQFHTIDVAATLKQMMTMFPEEIPLQSRLKELTDKTSISMREFFQLMDYECNAFGEPKIKNELELNQETLEKRAVFMEKTAESLGQLNRLLPPYHDEDKIVVIHKKDSQIASRDDQFEEINQVALQKFIKEKIMHVSAEEKLSENMENQCKYLMKAYNLQFRLKKYASLLENPNKPVNFTNLERDLIWQHKLTDEIQKIMAENPIVAQQIAAHKEATIQHDSLNPRTEQSDNSIFTFQKFCSDFYKKFNGTNSTGIQNMIREMGRLLLSPGEDEQKFSTLVQTMKTIALERADNKWSKSNLIFKGRSQEAEKLYQALAKDAAICCLSIWKEHLSSAKNEVPETALTNPTPTVKL